MKKVITLISALILSATMMFAQESNRDANGNRQFGPYETNSFLSNWFVEVGGGVNVPVDGATQIFNGGLTYDFGGLAVNANIGKWFDPCYGVRLGWQGLTTGNLDNHITFKDSFNGEHAFNYIHGDFILNFSNLVAGYKETRLVNVEPYVTAGAAFAEWSTRRSFALGGGIQVPFRVSNRVSIVPNVQLVCLNSHVYGGEKITGNASASIDVRVNLGKTNWTRKATTVGEYQSLIDAANDAVARANSSINDLKVENVKIGQVVKDLEDENAALERALAEERNKTCEPEVYDFAVYFEIGKATLSEKEIAHLEYCANAVIKTHSKVKFYIAGGADSDTGSKKRNAELSKKRAECIYKLLSGKFGVDNIEQVETPVMDSNPSPVLSRMAVITVK